jgi:hypothetical protein
MINDNAQNVHLDFPCRHCRRETSGTVFFFHHRSDWVPFPWFPILPELLQDVYLQTRIHLWFMHDGALSHFLLAVRELLKVFLWQWIEWDGPTAWPVHSPDLNPFDFYLCWHMKPTICAIDISDVQDCQPHGRVNLRPYVRPQEFSSESGRQ